MTNETLSDNQKKAIAIFYRVKAALIDPEIEGHKLWEVAMQLEKVQSYHLSESFSEKYIELSDLKSFAVKLVDMFENKIREEEENDKQE